MTSYLKSFLKFVFSQKEKKNIEEKKMNYNHLIGKSYREVKNHLDISYARVWTPGMCGTADYNSSRLNIELKFDENDPILNHLKDTKNYSEEYKYYKEQIDNAIVEQIWYD
jgi:hypothetical protein